MIYLPRSASAGQRSIPTPAPLFSRAQNWLGARLEFARRYSFADRWRVPGTAEQVAEVFLDTGAFTQWWPQLFAIEVAGSPGERSLQRRFGSRAQGFLPYVLDLEFHVASVRYPNEFVVELAGDLVGRGHGKLRQEGPVVAIDFDTALHVGRPLLRMLSLVARPLLVAQHQWVMKQGERGLARELDRRRLAESPTL